MRAVGEYPQCRVRNSRHWSFVIGHLQRQTAGNREPARGGQAGGRGTGGEGPAKGGQAEGTAKTADGGDGRESGFGIRRSGLGNARETSPPHRGGMNRPHRGAGGNGRELTVRPDGRRTVATGEAPAAAWRAVRNPWKRSCFNTPAPRGRRKRRAQASFRRPKNLLRPAGAKRGEKPRPLFLIRFPRVPRRAAVRPRRSTRGYNPPPRWG